MSARRDAASVCRHWGCMAQMVVTTNNELYVCLEFTVRYSDHSMSESG